MTEHASGLPPLDQGSHEEALGSSHVLTNRSFLLLWLSQVATQVGSNMVLYGLTVLVYERSASSAAVSLLLLTFLVPGVVFSAVAGVYVDRIDRRYVLVATNLLRAVATFLMLPLAGSIHLILLLNLFVATVTTFFAPAETAMIPVVVSRGHLIAANGLFTLTLNAAFALGFAFLGPLVVTIAGPLPLIGLVGVLYLVAAVFCFTLPAAPVVREHLGPIAAIGETEKALRSTVGQFTEGIAYIRENPNVRWSILNLGIAAGLVGILGVLGPDFATRNLGLAPKDFVVVVLPLGAGIVTGVLLLGRVEGRIRRRTLVEVGLIGIGIAIVALSAAAPLARFLQGVGSRTAPLLDLSALLSLLSIVTAIAFLAGTAYAFIQIPAQTQLQEDLPEEVRGRVFGILYSLISAASFLPIVLAGPISDAIGGGYVLALVGLFVFVIGVASVRSPRGAPFPTGAAPRSTPTPAP